MGALTTIEHALRDALLMAWSVWWALVLGLLPGFLTATLHDLTDPLSVALVLAGLVADGETVVSGAHHIARGYEDLPGALCSLGARVTRR